MRRIIATIALLGMSLVMMLAPTPASAASDVEVTAATLVARGVAVDVSLSVTCQSGLSGGAEMIIRQRSGDRVASASGWGPVYCTGQPQIVTGRAWVEGGGLVIKPGVALISGGFELCGDVGCSGPRFEQTFRITR
ncbi:hypothetical protein HNR22_002062 [Micromonospora jinlongensis]|uniref:Uncharacterized protein n=1 Tax=Micromonospora jinlongensis TaxID=1287877 RepID=A0A7Y9X0W5_9ACTN|nr:hypothetical protein [Micromonospora jinlongensis]NYH42335.1 hypothetical protein [Micromonospora jinlongensis]